MAKVAPFKREAEKTAAHEIALAFDDNRLASLVFGQYDQNLAQLERRLGVSTHANGNQVVIRGPREACEQARRVLQTLYQRARPGAGRRRGRRRGRAGGIGLPEDAVSRRGRGAARGVRRIAHAPARRRARPQRRAGRLFARAAPARTGVRRRARRHRQDLARGRPRRLAAGAGRGRAAGAVAPGGGGGRAARLPARRHEGQGRSLSAPDLRRAL